MIDTDKIKRIAEGLVRMDECPMLVPPETILDLIAENKALHDYGKNAAQEAVQYRKERDEAVALLRTCLAVRDDGDAAAEHLDDARGFLDKMDREAQ